MAAAHRLLVGIAVFACEAPVNMQSTICCLHLGTVHCLIVHLAGSFAWLARNKQMLIPGWDLAVLFWSGLCLGHVEFTYFRTARLA